MAETLISERKTGGELYGGEEFTCVEERKCDICYSVLKINSFGFFFNKLLQCITQLKYTVEGVSKIPKFFCEIGASSPRKQVYFSRQSLRVIL